MTVNNNSAFYDGDLYQFLSDIRGIPMLTHEEELALAKQCANGEEEAILKLVNANLRLVVYIAKEYAGRGIPLLDLIQEGSIGLLTAAKKYDYTMQVHFSTYAAKWIRQGVTRCLLRENGLIRIPVHTYEKIRKIHLAREKYQKAGEPFSIEQIALETGISAENIKKYLMLYPDVISLDVPVGDNQSYSIGTLVEDFDTPQPQEALVRRELEQILRNMLSTLSERQQMILRMHFGLEQGKCFSLEEIASILHLSKERVRQIELQAIGQLKQLGTSIGLEDFLNE